MESKKNVTLNGENWIIDLETASVYRNVDLITKGDGFLPMSGKLGNFPLYKFRDDFYFEINDIYYKYSSGEVIEITKNDFDEIREYRFINKNDPATFQNVSSYMIAIIIDEIMMSKYNIRVSFPIEPSHFLTRFSKKFTPEINMQFNLLVKEVTMELPTYIKRKSMKQSIKEIYKRKYLENKSFFESLIDNIYSNDILTFDFVRKYILRNRGLVQNQYPDLTRNDSFYYDHYVMRNKPNNSNLSYADQNGRKI